MKERLEQLRDRGRDEGMSGATEFQLRHLKNEGEVVAY